MPKSSPCLYKIRVITNDVTTLILLILGCFHRSALLVNLAKAIGPLLFHSTRVLGGEEKRKVISKFLQIKHIIKATQERVKVGKCKRFVIVI